MHTDAQESLLTLLHQLTGEPECFGAAPPAATQVLEHAGLGYSQFNEILLSVGYDRISPEMFQYLVDGHVAYSPSSQINGLDHLRQGVDRFRQLGLLLFGNVKFAYKTYSSDGLQLEEAVASLEPRGDESFAQRHRPVQPIERIAASETYLLGYLVDADLKQRLAAAPGDANLLRLQARRADVVEIGKRNHAAYLVSDHLDVYVATSMREQHEYILVSEFCDELFEYPDLKNLNLRWFDPTQAYCSDRIDKGLAEALMLKRAKCTIYLVQESDTLGKDSELASTLAQGKPVVAYVPRADEAFVNGLVGKVTQGQANRRVAAMLTLLQIFNPKAAWERSDVRGWLDDPGRAQREEAQLYGVFVESVGKHYDSRAITLSERHPLGIQVNLASGVANGVLVVRTVSECAELVRRIVTGQLLFDVDEQSIDGQTYVFLREKISRGIFRVMTGDKSLTNSFWNFYLNTL